MRTGANHCNFNLASTSFALQYPRLKDRQQSIRPIRSQYIESGYIPRSHVYIIYQRYRTEADF